MISTDFLIFREHLKRIKEKETHNTNSIYCLETQLKHTKSALEISNKSVYLFKKEAENQKKNNSEISAELKLMTV